MGVNMKKMRGDYNKRQKAGEFWQPEAGDTIVYVCPPCRPNDKYEPTEGLNYIPATVHYQVGKNNAMVMSLDSEANPIIDHPFLKAFLKKAKKKLTGHCPMREFLENDANEQEAENSRPQTKYLWNVVPIKHRAKKGSEWTKLEPAVRPYMSGKTVYDGIMELFFEIGDITELDGAILVKISKTGKGLNTKYKVSADVASLKKPYVLPAALVKKIKEVTKEGGDCDLFRVVANMVKSPSEVEALLSGVKLDEADDDDDDMADDDDDGDEEGDDDTEDEEEPEEDDDSEDEEEEPEEDEEEEPEEDDDEGDDDSEDDEGDDDSEDEEEEPEEDEEEPEEDEEEEEEPEEEPKPKRKGLPKKGEVKKNKAKASASDIEDDLAALDAELEAVTKKKTTSKKKVVKKKQKAS